MSWKNDAGMWATFGKVLRGQRQMGYFTLLFILYMVTENQINAIIYFPYGDFLNALNLLNSKKICPNMAERPFFQYYGFEIAKH